MAEENKVAPQKAQEIISKVTWQEVIRKETTDVAQPFKGRAESAKEAKRAKNLINKYCNAEARVGTLAGGRQYILLNNRQALEEAFPVVEQQFRIKKLMKDSDKTLESASKYTDDIINKYGRNHNIDENFIKSHLGDHPKNWVR